MLRVVGAGLPRTGTKSLQLALERLLGGPCLHMSAIPDHPFDLGEGWRTALTGGDPDWDELLDGFVAAVDWPASACWRELHDAWPHAVVLLSTRASAEVWSQSFAATVLPVAQRSRAPDWQEGRDLATIMERFTGTTDWDDRETLVAAYERHNRAVRATVPTGRLIDWRPGDGWKPLCDALGVRVPAEQFPWLNLRADWG